MAAALPTGTLNIEEAYTGIAAAVADLRRSPVSYELRKGRIDELYGFAKETFRRISSTREAADRGLARYMVAAGDGGEAFLELPPQLRKQREKFVKFEHQWRSLVQELLNERIRVHSNTGKNIYTDYSLFQAKIRAFTGALASVKIEESYREALMRMITRLSDIVNAVIERFEESNKVAFIDFELFMGTIKAEFDGMLVFHPSGQITYIAEDMSEVLIDILISGPIHDILLTVRRIIDSQVKMGVTESEKEGLDKAVREVFTRVFGLDPTTINDEERFSEVVTAHEAYAMTNTIAAKLAASGMIRVTASGDAGVD